MSIDLHARFQRDGFVVVPQLVDAEALRAIAAGFDRLYARGTRLACGLTSAETASIGVEHTQFVLDGPSPPCPVGRIHRAVGVGGVDAELGRLGAHPALVHLAAELLQSAEVVQIINQAHFKLPGDDVAFPWHIDAWHRRYGTAEWVDVSGRGSFVEVALAVDAMTADNGPLRVVPGSHHRGYVPQDPVSGGLPSGAFDEEQAIAVRLEPGDAVAFGPFVVHGSAPNTSPHPRRLFLNGFALPGANRRAYPWLGEGRLLRDA